MLHFQPAVRGPLAAGAALALILTSCTTTNPYTGEEQVSKTSAGAGLGALGGALLGGIIGNNVGDGDAGTGAAIGAVIGGMAGAGVGNSMDKQEAALRQQLSGSGVSVTRVGDGIVLNMPHDITFESGRDTIHPDFAGTLDSVALVLNKYKDTLVEVNGYTDSDGAASYNQELSERRASAVSVYLANQRVDVRRLVSRGFGESDPIASNASSAGKARNRRVEIHIGPR
jgi:outer membrane protein OmpA-like peptidoglycan-associated protein